MQPVNFKCGHCGNLMAVGAEFLGQQVRCPHCQQVVIAPSAAQLSAVPPGPDKTAMLPPPGRDDFPAFDDRTENVFLEPKPPADSPPIDATLPFLPTTPAGQAATLAEGTSSNPDMPDWMKASPPAPSDSPAPARARRGLSLGTLLFFGLVFMPLVLYSVLATILLILSLNRTSEAPKDPREYLQDVEGDHPGVKKLKSSLPPLDVDMKFATHPLPDNLRIKLGESLTLGDLYVKAKGVERGEIQMTTPGFVKSAEMKTLKLHLHLKNVSADTAFYPMDYFFDRKWKPGKGGYGAKPPLTVLLAGDDLRFFGGPSVWHRGAQGREDNPERRYFIDGNSYDRELKPGEEMDTFVCVDGRDAKWNELVEYTGPLVWHVHVRRGAVRWKDHDYPATAVFGVEFTDKDVTVAAD
jgi:hypothetical protein